jgi:hypothetical protein
MALEKHWLPRSMKSRCAKRSPLALARRKKC